MFSRAATNPLDDLVSKATDENLTSENWELILSVCDKVDADTENGARNAILAVQKRLGHRNANVQLSSLTLAEALSKNCGSKVHREIASRAFTQSLLRLVNDRTIHNKVKTRTGQLVKQWAETFSSDPSLGIMSETFHTLKAQGISLDPPSRPMKREITEVDRRREEEELQIALAMSLQETSISHGTTLNEQPQQSRRIEIDQGPNAYTLPTATVQNGAYTLPTPYDAQGQTAVTQPLQQAPVADRTAATVSRCRALYDFVASEAGELSFHRGDVITVIESAYKDWWRGSLRGIIGIFPTNYVENLPEPTAADLQREAEEEARVFSEAKNVEKLLSILSSAELSDPSLAENEQLQNLYHSTISIRPKLVRLIEKYAQKKDDLISLNEKFMKARKDYDELMEATLARYNTTQAYAPRASYEPRGLGNQRPPPAGGYPHADYQRPQHTDEHRQPYPAQAWADSRRPIRSGTAQYSPRLEHSSSAGVAQTSSAFRVPHRNSNDNVNSDVYRKSQPSNTAQARQDHSFSTNNDIAPLTPGGTPLERGYAARPFNGTPSSPSQELTQAFSPTLRQSRSESFPESSRNQVDGLPPISYYEERAMPPQNSASAQHSSTQNYGSDPAAYYR